MADLSTSDVIEHLEQAAAVIEVTDTTPQKRFKVRGR